MQQERGKEKYSIQARLKAQARIHAHSPYFHTSCQIWGAETCCYKVGLPMNVTSNEKGHFTSLNLILFIPATCTFFFLYLGLGLGFDCHVHWIATRLEDWKSDEPDSSNTEVKQLQTRDVCPLLEKSNFNVHSSCFFQLLFFHYT